MKAQTAVETLSRVRTVHLGPGAQWRQVDCFGSLRNDDICGIPKRTTRRVDGAGEFRAGKHLSSGGTMSPTNNCRPSPSALVAPAALSARSGGTGAPRVMSAAREHPRVAALSSGRPPFSCRLEARATKAAFHASRTATEGIRADGHPAAWAFPAQRWHVAVQWVDVIHMCQRPQRQSVNDMIRAEGDYVERHAGEFPAARAERCGGGIAGSGTRFCEVGVQRVAISMHRELRVGEF